MLDIVLFIVLAVIFVATLTAQRFAWARESALGAYRDGNKIQIRETAICYVCVSVLLFVLCFIASNLPGVMQPHLNLTLLALFLLLSGSMSFGAIKRKTSVPAAQAS